MANGRRGGGGGGAVVAAVFGWVFAIGMAVLALVVYQKLAAVQAGVKQNQKAFEDSIGEYFALVQTPLPKNESAEFGFIYGDQAYAAVRKELEKAKRYDGLVGLLQWKDDKAAEDSIKVFLDQLPERDKIAGIGSLRALYEHYANLIDRYNRENNDLKEKYASVLKEQQSMLAAEKAQVESRRKEAEQLRKENQQKFEEFAAELANVRKLWQKVVGERDGLAKELEAVKLDLNKKVVERDKTIKTLEDRIAVLERKKEAIKTLNPDGRVIQVKKSLNMVYLSGGKDQDRRPNEHFIIYSVTPLGERVKKGELVVKAVYDYTLMGSMISEDQHHPVIEGDLYVDSRLWDEFQSGQTAGKPAETSAAPKAEVQPAKGAAEAGETKKEEAKKEETKKEETKKEAPVFELE